MVITYPATLLEKKELAPHIQYFKFSHPTDTNWDYKAGQYMIFHIPQDSTHAARRLYSIASPPFVTDALEFIIEYVPNGIASQFLASHAAGTQLTMQGPAGMFFYKETVRTPVFLATGTGIAPIYAIICDLLEKNVSKSIYLFWGLKLHENLYYFDKFKDLAAKHPNFQFKICFSREEGVPQLLSEEDKKYCICGRVNAGFEELLTTIHSTPELHDYYICGGKHVVESLREYLASKNVPKENINFEKFTT